MRRLACLSVVIALCAWPAAAGAQGLLNTPQIAPPTVPQPTQTVTKAPTSNGDGGLNTAETIGLFAFGIGLIVVIAIIIVGDARSKAPVAAPEDLGGETASLHRHRQVKARRRAKGREAKAQRRKNRPR